MAQNEDKTRRLPTEHRLQEWRAPQVLDVLLDENVRAVLPERAPVVPQYAPRQSVVSLEDIAVKACEVCALAADDPNTVGAMKVFDAQRPSLERNPSHASKRSFD